MLGEHSGEGGFSAADITGDSYVHTLLLRLEHIFSDSAQRTCPILRDILKSSSGRYAAVRIANCRIVYITTNSANVSFHHLLV